jgi:glucose/arabinose dehydrogenase
MRILSLLFVLLAAVSAAAQPRLTPHKVTLANGRAFSLNLPAEFEIKPAAEGLRRVRFFARAPDGRIFVTDMYNLTDNRRGAVYILDGWDAATGRFERIIPYMTGLRNPNSVQFYRDTSGQGWIYLAETDKLTRRKFVPGETRPSDTEPETIATFPDYGLSYKYGGWHLTRTIAFGPNGKLYVSVGSSCNSCVEKERVRASVIEMNPDGSDQREFASGLRNAVGLKWIGNFLWATNQGSDHLGLRRPDETFYALKDGSDHGWPYCHSSGGRIFSDPKFKRSGGCRGVTAPYAYFPARSSALGFDYFDDPDSPYLIRDAFLVALHGSTNKTIGRGYKIVVMRKGQPLQDLVTGFLQKGKVVGRPCDILRLDANSFLFTDDHTGIIYYVRKIGWETQISVSQDRPADGRPSADQIPPNPTQGLSKSCISMILLIAASFRRGAA